MKKFTFTGSQGNKLDARLDKPDGPVRAYALFAHCFTCGKDIFGASRIAKQLTANGIAVVRFDFTGLGKSEGEFENTDFSSNIEDLISAAKHMDETLQAPSILIGHSLGGTAALAAASRIPSVKSVATIGAPADTEHVQKHFESSKDEILENGIAQVELGGRAFKIRKEFIEDIQSQNMSAHIKDLKAALLIMHAPMDETVGIDNAETIYKAAKHPKSFIALDGADHLLSRKADAEYAANLIAAWAKRFIETNNSAAALMPPQYKGLNDESVLIASTGNGKFQHNVFFGKKHHMLADEPEDMGGDGTGPDPYGLLQAALGACTSMTLQMYADRKDIALEHVRTTVTHDKQENDDGDKIDVFHRIIDIHGEHITEDVRARFLEIADKCPVHKTLEGSAKIYTSKT